MGWGWMMVLLQNSDKLNIHQSMMQKYLQPSVLNRK